MKKMTQALWYALGVKISSLCKMSFIVGSQTLWLSGPAVLAPLSGAFAGLSGASFVLCLRLLIHFLLFKTFSLSFLAFCIPGYFAALYWACPNAFIRMFVPLSCMALFIVHPIGSQAFIYSFYWLIPVVLYITRQKSLFSQALGSTFVAHAVGSVIWLYTVPMTASLWLGLIPVVAAERLLFAGLMVVAHKLFSTLTSFSYRHIMGYSNGKAFSMYNGWKPTLGN